MWKKCAAGILVGLVALPSAANAWGEDQVRPDIIDKIFVLPDDGASGGCWTNIGEAKSYATDMLSSRGLVVGPPEEHRADAWNLVIKVDASRHKEGFCHGNINVSVQKFEGKEKYSSIVTIADIENSFVYRDNANTGVLITLERMLKH
ncbi:hypothetical protein [Caenispirillum salinarum]|uniref:hypothetical protein n=1 Tax=Caenispirillum salinarum TaxID=859058 RepID=UPI00384CF70E